MNNPENRKDIDPEDQEHRVDPDSNEQQRSGSQGPPEDKQRAELMPALSRANDAALPANASQQVPGAMPPVMSTSDIVKSVLRHKWLMMIIAVVVAAPALALIWMQIVPKYQARAQVRVRPIIPFLVFKTEESGTIPLYDSYLQTQSSIIKTDTVLLRVLDLPEVQVTGWYRNPPQSLVQRITKAPADPLDNLKKALSATPVKGTELIDVTFSDASATEAQLILNSVLDQYVNSITDMSDATQDEIYEQLVNQYNSLESEIQGREKVTAKLRQELGTSDPEELISAQRVRLDEAQARLSEVRQNIKLLQWEIAQTRADMNDVSEVNDTPDVPDADTLKKLLYYQDDEWCRLDINVKTIENSIKNTRATESSPDYVQLQDDLAFAKDTLGKREQQLDLQLPYRQKNLLGLTEPDAIGTAEEYEEKLRSLEYELGKAMYQEQLLDADYLAQEETYNSLFKSAQSLETENTTIEHRRDLFTAVRQRIDQKSMERNVPGSIEILARAGLPTKPYQDRRIMLSVMAMFFALALGSSAAFVKDRREGIFTELNDLPYPMQVTLLGSVPDIASQKRRKGLLKSLFKRTKPNWPAVMDAVRIVRTALLSRLDGRKGTTILITSSVSGVEKTDFTMMLGASLSQAGRKVLVIDADFRKMALTKQCPNVPEQHGFIHALRREGGYKQDIFPTEMPNLDMVPAGDMGDNIVLEEIAGASLQNFIDNVRKQYDIVLVDSAPILSQADTAILSTRMDGTILVERQFRSRQEDTIAALSRLASAGGRLLGTVMIGAEN